MTDLHPRPTARGPHGRDGRAPRWAIVLGIVIAIHLVALIVLLHLTGTIGPGIH